MQNEVFLGDCLEIIKQIESNSVDLVLTDPPYNISRESNFKKNSTNKKYNNISLDFGIWDQSEIDLDTLFGEIKRVLKKNGTLIIFYDIWKSYKIKFYAEKWGFKQPRVGQWVKTNPVPINSKNNYLSNSIEFFFTFVKGGSPTFKSSYDNGIYQYPLCHGRERTIHPTQKPLRLLEDLIDKHSNENDLILDPFAGSGTTGIASINKSRRYIMIEKDTVYFEVIKSRIEQNKIKKI